MRQLLPTAGAAFVLVGSTHAQMALPDPYQSRIVQTGAFNRLEVSGPFKVGVLVGDQPSQIHLYGPPALLADAIASVDGDTLKIRFRDGVQWSWNTGSGVNIVVSAPRLDSARVKGAAEVEINQVRGESFSAATDGSGTIALDGIDIGRAMFATDGSGAITADGRASHGSYAVGGSGSIDAKRLRVETASIAVGGSGSIYADVSGTANVSVAGSGRVDVVGGATCINGRANSAHIDCR